MLNLVELGSNCSFCFLLCLKCTRSSFQEKSSNFDRKKDFTSNFKKDWRFKDAPRIKGSKIEHNSGQHAQNRRRYGRKIGRTDRAPKTHHDRSAREVARPCRAQPCARSRFSTFLFRFSFTFGGLLPNFFQSSFREKIRV